MVGWGRGRVDSGIQVWGSLQNSKRDAGDSDESSTSGNDENRLGSGFILMVELADL